ncbi:MAG: DUF3179 domain-containing protein [Chloroflexota bacterium]
MKRTVVMIGLAVLALGVVAGLFGTGNDVLAQRGNGVGDCDDPFGDANIQFNVGFWDLTDFCQTNIDYNDVLSGGPPPDGIPPIDDPIYESIDAASNWLNDESPVIAVEVNGEARAYPLAVLTWHEIVNTDLGGEPISVTFCPLCNSAIVFDRNVDGDILDFGVSGNLRNSDLIMFDRQTESWWQQFTGEGIVGVYTDTQLEILPSQVVGFAQFVAQFPESEVLSRETGHSRSYGANPYTGYDSTERPFLFRGDVDPRLQATSRVLAGFVGGQSVAYPFGTLNEEIVINDVVDEREVVALWQPGSVSALDQRSIDNSRDVGTAGLYSRVLEDGTVLTFSANDDGQIVDDQTGSVWSPFGTAVEGELEGERLRQVVAGAHFWFAWAAFQPESIVYGMES